MASTVLDVLDTLEGAPTLDALGGEHGIYESADVLVHDSRVVEVAVALCNGWGALDDQDAARQLLLGAVESIPAFSAGDLYDVLLTSESVLPQISTDLEQALKHRAEQSGLARDFALEAWTRLALGNFGTMALHLRAALQDGSSAPDATPTLVRALGAALSKWGDENLRTALHTLTEHDDLNSDAAMELGLDWVARATARTELDDVRSGLGEAQHWFDAASADEGRPDAVAFHAVISGVLDQADGHSVTEERYQSICDSVYGYLDGYHGVSRGWRAARGETSTAWLELLNQLHQADTDAWYDPPRTIENLARTLAAETTMTLVVSQGGTGQAGIRALVQPHVDNLVKGNGAILSHVRRWLDAAPSGTEQDTRAAVEALLVQLETPPKKAGGESTAIPESIRDRLNLTPGDATILADVAAEHPDLTHVYEQLALYSYPVGYAESVLLDQLLDACEQYAQGGISQYRYELGLVLKHVVRFAAFHLDEGQSGQRASPWMADDKPWPLEHELADDLNRQLRMSGLTSVVEQSNTAGGRVDIAITFPRCRICIEVKRTDQDLSDDQLVADFGPQAVQYAATDVPVALLVTADYLRRTKRLDLTGAFHVAPLRLQKHSRQNALVSVRMQANVATPSASSPSRI
ncbi:hypothetical protein CVS47_02185 [Microbacterium lemovicicum]|uniref:Uncharacterized protein n=1 Tax=Microbacterium lemovicicum TaxID=1072463 RepID=A0A3Q9IZP5_9MICO|nr:hypothetical protein [Microbacterium lemovicicum]AZS37548.1 hypothetical protein CVS47_02185 [Microbacterium lemovicicum]